MVKINLFDFQVLLKSAFHPLTPVFVGSWRGQFSTKWRGVSAELSYNTYLRNGWVVIDTGVKSETGTPIVEFSSWEPYVSHSNITFPNVLSYKFFFKKAFWRVGFLTRTSVVANEEWAGSLPDYLSVYNNTKRGGFFRKNNWNLLLSGKPLNFIIQRFIFFRTDLLRNFYIKNELFTLNLGNFYLFETVGLLKRKVNMSLLLTSQFFKTIVYGKVSRLKQVGIFATSKRSFKGLKELRKFSLYDILFKMATLFLLNVERASLGGVTPFFSITLRTLVSDFVFLSTGGAFGSKSVLNFLFKKFNTLFENSRLNFSFFLRISGYAFDAIARFLRNYVSVEMPALTTNYLLNQNLVSSKLRLLHQAQLHLNSKVSPLFSSVNVALRDFLQGFAPRFFVKKRANRSVFMKSTSFFTRKVGKFANKGGAKVVALAGAQVYPRLIKYRRKPVTRFKLSLFKKQFSFLHFWVINFFSFFALKPNSKKLAWMSTRLKFFFRSFLKFLKFYSFTSEYFSIAFNETFRQRTRFLVKFNSLRLYFWFLLKRARVLLGAFWSFSSKLSRNYFTTIDFRATKAFADFSCLALRLTKQSGLTSAFDALSTLKPQLNIFSREVRALRSVFLSLHSSFLSARTSNERGLIFKVRNFLRFTLLVRRAAFYCFNRQLGITVGASEVGSKSNGFYKLNVSSLLRAIVEKKFFRVFLMPRKTFINFIFCLRHYFTANLSKNVRYTLGMKRLLNLLVALSGNNGTNFVLNKIIKTLCLARRLILRRARKIDYISALVFKEFTPGFKNSQDSKIFDFKFLPTKPLFIKKMLIRMSLVTNEPYTLRHSIARGVRHLMRFPLAKHPASVLPLGLFQQPSISTEELKLAALKIRVFIILFKQAQAKNYLHIILRPLGNFRPFSRLLINSISHLESRSGGLLFKYSSNLGFGFFTQCVSGPTTFNQNNILAFNLMHLTLLKCSNLQPHWAVKLINAQTITLKQLLIVALVQNYERLGKISFLNFFMQVRSVTKALAQRINNSVLGEHRYSLQPVVFPMFSLTKIMLNRATYLTNSFYRVAVNFTDGKFLGLTLHNTTGVLISARSNTTTGVNVWRTFCLRFLPFFIIKRAARRNIVRKWTTGGVRAMPMPIFGSHRRSFKSVFANQRKIARGLSILSLNLVKHTLNSLRFSPHILRSSKYAAVKLFTVASNSVGLLGQTETVGKSFLFAFVRNVLTESSMRDSFTLINDVGRMQEIAFRKVRAIRKILLRSNARRLGVFPKRSKHLKKMYWKLVNSGKLEPVVPDYVNSQRSIFDRRNRHSMELSAQRAKKRFRFTTVKLQFTVKKQLWSQLILLLDRIKKVMRLFRVKIWRRRFYRLFRAGRWSLRKKVKKKFIRLIVKSAYFLQKIYYGGIPARFLSLVARVNALPFNHVMHNSSALMRSFYLRVLARVAVLRSQNCLFVRHTLFKEVKLNFIYKFIYWFVKKISMFLLNLRVIFFNFAHMTNKISVLALMGVREGCAFLRSSCLSSNQNMTYNFYNPSLFKTNTITQSGSWLAGYLTSASVALFSDSICNTTILLSSVNLISRLFAPTNTFFVWKRASKYSGTSSLNWTFLINRHIDLLRVASTTVLAERRSVNRLILKRVLRDSNNLFALRRLNLAINMSAHPYAKLLERVTAKKPNLGFLNKSFGRSRLKFQKKTGKILNRAISMKRALRLV